MDEDLLIQRRTELKHVINEGMEKTFPAYFFKLLAGGLSKYFASKSNRIG